MDKATKLPYSHPGQTDFFMPVFNACGSGQLCPDATCSRKHCIPCNRVAKYYIASAKIFHSTLATAYSRAANGTATPLDHQLADVYLEKKQNAQSAKYNNVANSRLLATNGYTVPLGDGLRLDVKVSQILRSGGAATGCYFCDRGRCDGVRCQRTR
jgi:hypothetical protein